jgi:mannose-6-phosphate isomerase-like protein (cupin superfamily)
VRDGAEVTHAFSSLDELGEGAGFRKVRTALGVTAFGVNAVVYPPHFDGFHHYHDLQDELYFVHRGRVSVEVEGETRELGEGGLFHATAATPRKVSNPFDEEAVLYIVGGKDGYVERDGHLVDPADAERRASFGKS